MPKERIIAYLLSGWEIESFAQAHAARSEDRYNGAFWHPQLLCDLGGAEILHEMKDQDYSLLFRK